MALVERLPLWRGMICNMTIFLGSTTCLQCYVHAHLSHNDNGNPVIYNIKYSDRNIHQKIEKILNENVVNETKLQGSQHLLKYVCIIAINMLTAAV